MARNPVHVVRALKHTADKLRKADSYQWGHMGSCNCGFLTQEVLGLSRDDIHRSAMERSGDWNEQLNDYCPTSGLRMDSMIAELIAFGFDTDDLRHLERLSDPKVLRTLPFSERNLKHNVKADVIQYLNAWATMIENQLLEGIDISALHSKHSLSVEW